VRAPIAEGGGFAWFPNRGIGRPVAESLRGTMAWFRAWLDTVAPPGRPVVLVGFSGGAAFAGGLLLDDPSRDAGAAVLYGTLSFDAGVPTMPDRLAGVPVLVAQGEHDTVIPRELLERFRGRGLRRAAERCGARGVAGTRSNYVRPGRRHSDVPRPRTRNVRPHRRCPRRDAHTTSTRVRPGSGRPSRDRSGSGRPSRDRPGRWGGPSRIGRNRTRTVAGKAPGTSPHGRAVRGRP
jgi:hypothetical protein